MQMHVHVSLAKLELYLIILKQSIIKQTYAAPISKIGKIQYVQQELVEKHIYLAWASNYIPQNTVDVIIYPSPWHIWNKLQWSFNRSYKPFIQESAFENIVCIMVKI